jgi:C_GCAxxG_C_C family probable redox protein
MGNLTTDYGENIPLKSESNKTNKAFFAERALEHYKSGFHCSESTILALVEYLNIKSDLFPRIASGFHGGYALSGLVCGALSSSVMALSIKFGRNDLLLSPWSASDKVNQLVKDFKGHVGTLLCPEIMQCDVWNPIQLQDYIANRRIAVCGEKVIKFVVSRTIEIMEMEWPPPGEGPIAKSLGMTSLSNQSCSIITKEKTK